MKRLTLACLTLAVAAWCITAAYGETGNELFEKALVKERAQGDLQGAIKLYQQVVDKYGKDRTLAAKALVEIGQNYEKLGRALDARAAFERVRRDFAAQTASANQATARLAAIESAAATVPVTRQVWTDSVYGYGSVSPDGRYLSFTDVATGDLAVRDLMAGTNRRVTAKVGGWFTGRAHAEFSIISPDSRQIAYAWSSPLAKLRVVSLTGTEPDWGQSFGESPENLYLEPMAWTPDGRNLIVGRLLADRSREFALLSLSDGSIRTIKKQANQTEDFASLSPDGRFLAYAMALKAKPNVHDIYVIGLDGSGDTAAVQSPANDHYPMWSPDGSRLIFVSDRTRGNSLWSLAMTAGKPTGEPELLKGELGPFVPIGMTRDGAILYTSGGYSNNIGGGLSNIYIAEVNDDLILQGSPVLATQQFLNSNAFPSWSPDGESLAYFSQRAPSGTAHAIALVIRSMQTGVERLVPTTLDFNTGQQIQWFPDGKSVLVGGRIGDAGGIYRIDLETGIPERLVPNPAGKFSLSSDGKTLYHFKPDPTAGAQTILWRDLASGTETELKRRPQNDRRPFTSLAISPDGTQLAYVIRDDTTQGGSVEVIPATGGASREVFHADRWIGGSPAAGLAWTPDQRYLVFENGKSDPGAGHYFWRVPASGGQPENMGFGIQGQPNQSFAGNASIHPDGHRIAYYSSDNSVSEVWALENFLTSSGK